MITRRAFSASLLAAGVSAADLEKSPARAVTVDGSTSAACRIPIGFLGDYAD